jgi:hypothetical protein
LHSSTRVMTLAQFCEFTKLAAKPFFPASYSNPDEPKVYTLYDSQVLPQDRWALHHLTDYVVSSITAGTIWLVERTNA